MTERPFAEQLEEWVPALRAYARVLTRDRARADDLVQDTLERALIKQHLWQSGTNLRAWLFTVMYRVNVTQMRDKRRAGELVLPADDGGVIEDTPAADDPEMGLVIRDLKRALNCLPADQRRLLLMIGEGQSYEEAAAVEYIPVGTVRSRLSRGREELRHIMDGGASRPGRGRWVRVPRGTNSPPVR